MFRFIILLFIPFALFANMKSDNNQSKIDSITEEKDKSELLSEDELRLMYQVFLYKTELESAYKVAHKALNRFPNSIEWHRKLAEVSLWSDRPKEAMDHYHIVYNAKPTAKLREMLIDTSLEYFQYEKAKELVKSKLLESPTSDNIRQFSFVWQEAGDPISAADFLYDIYKKDHLALDALEEALAIYINMGELKKVEILVKEIKKDNIDTEGILDKVSFYHYFSHRISDSYETLLKLKKDKNDEVDFLRKLSDLGWYLGDYKNAVDASIGLMKLNSAKREDYERIISMEKTYPKLAREAAMRSWHEYHKPYAFYSFAYLSLDNREYKDLIKVIEKIEEGGEFSYFNQDYLYYLVKSQAYQLDGDKSKSKKALLKAMNLKPNSVEVTSALLWFYMDESEDIALEKLISKLDKKDLSYQLYIPMAAAFFHLQNINKSKKYILKVLKKEKNNIDVKLTYAYILQIENEFQPAIKQMKEVYTILHLQLNKNPSLKRDDEFLDRYLRVAMYVMNPDSFVYLLKSSKDYMNSKTYSNIALLWSLRNLAYERTRMLTNSLSNVESWIILTQSLHFRDNLNLQDLLYKYYRQLPIRDRVDSVKRSGNYSFGYSLAFDGLEKNSNDELIYNQFKNFSEDRADKLSADSHLLSRDTLIQKGISIKNRNYLRKGYWLYSNFDYVKNSIKNQEILRDVPDDDLIFKMGIKKEFDRGSATVWIGYRDAMEDYTFASADIFLKFSNRIDLKVDMGYKTLSDETVYLLLGGNKDYLKTNISFSILPSLSLSFEYAYARYNSQDSVYLGDGIRTKIELYKTLRLGYPDMTISMFGEFGRYNEKSSHKSIIEQLLAESTAVLPVDFNNIGLGFNYGMQNYEGYTRVWRPYFSFTPFYDSAADGLNFSFSGGVGGELFNQDHTQIGFNYNKAVNGTQERSFKLYLRYNLLY